MRRTMVVTGGTGGIGRAVAEELTRQGHRVLTVGRGPTAEVRAGVLSTMAERKFRHTLDLDDLQLRGRGLWVAGRTQFANDLLVVELAVLVRPWLHETAERAS